MSRYNQTDIHPLALALTLGMAVAILMVRRDRAVVPLLLVACLVTHAQRIVVGGLDFSMLRIVILFGWARVLSQGETRDYRFHPLDAVLVAWLVFGTIAYTFGPRGSVDSFVQRLGVMLDAAGTYFLFRVLLRDVRDIQRSIETFSWLALLMAGPMILEFFTGRNAFSALGGVPEMTAIRNGRLRCQASFSHPIMAGSFGATTFALVGALWLAFPKQRLQHSASLVAAMIVTVFSASSGPLLASFGAIFGWALWPYRQYLPMLRGVSIISILVIHFAREQPFWHLIGRVSSITGGTGWHRVQLIDAFVRNFDEWWLLGAASTEHWKSAQGQDITNQYLLEGIRGGLATLLAFLLMFVLAFRTVGQAMNLAKSKKGWSAEARRSTTILAWGLGVCLAVHSIAFIGVSYFGQLNSILYLHLAMVPSLACALQRDARPERSSTSRQNQRQTARPSQAGPAKHGTDAAPAVARDDHAPTLARPKGQRPS